MTGAFEPTRTPPMLTVTVFLRWIRGISLSILREKRYRRMPMFGWNILNNLAGVAFCYPFRMAL